MTKLIQSNPYSHYTNQAAAWAAGFEAGQKSTLAPLSATGRWWKSNDGVIWFIPVAAYKLFQRTTDDNPKTCRWLTEEETREFT